MKVLAFIKQYRLIFALAILLLPWGIYGINTLAEGYQSTPSSNITINAASRSDACRKINNTSANTYFVPTNTAGEWSAFLSNLPPSTTAAQCCDVGQCWNGSGCIAADPDGDGQNSDDCNGNNNGGYDCRDDLGSVYWGAVSSCNGYSDDDCNGNPDGDGSLPPGYTPDYPDGITKITGIERTYYSDASCSSVAGYNLYYQTWDADCNTGVSSGLITMQASGSGNIGSCFLSQSINPDPSPNGTVTWQSRRFPGGECEPESTWLPAYAPNGTMVQPPGNSCRCSWNGYTWSCI